MYLLNAFSINMVKEGATVEFLPLTEEEAKDMLVMVETVDVEKGFNRNPSTTRPSQWLLAISAVGHADTASILSKILEVEVPTNRTNISFLPGDVAIVAQYVGPRLPEGATELPEGAQIKWFQVNVIKVDIVGELMRLVQKLQGQLLEVVGEEGIEDPQPLKSKIVLFTKKDSKGLPTETKELPCSSFEEGKKIAAAHGIFSERDWVLK